MASARSHQTTSNMIAILFMIAAALAITLFGFTNKEGARATSVELAVLMRFLIPTFIMAPFLLLLKDWGTLIADIKNNIWAYSLRAFFVMVGQYSLTYYIKDTNLLDAMTLYNSGPLFMPFLFWMIFKTPLRKNVLIALFLGLIGVILILKPRSKDFLSWYTFIGILSGFSMACSQVCQVYSSKNSNHLLNIFALYFLSSFLFTCLLLIKEIFYKQHLMFYIDWNGIVLAWFMLAALFSMLNQALKDFAYSKIFDANILTPFIYFSLLFSALLDWIIYDQFLTIESLLGSIIIVISALIIYKSTKKVID